MAVVADPEAVSFIAQHGGRRYVYADAAGLKHVKTQPPDDPSLQLLEIEADGFLMYVEADLDRPDVWNVKFHHLPFAAIKLALEARRHAPLTG